MCLCVACCAGLGCEEEWKENTMIQLMIAQESQEWAVETNASGMSWFLCHPSSFIETLYWSLVQVIIIPAHMPYTIQAKL